MKNYSIIKRGNKMDNDILIESYIEDLYLREEFQYLDEGAKEILSKLTPPVLKNILPKLFSIGASKDIKGYVDLLKRKGIKPKKVNPKDLQELAKVVPEELQDSAQFASRVISNSIPKASKKSKFAAGYIIALLAKVKNQKTNNIQGAVKKELKTFIPKVQQFYEEVEEKTAETGKRVLPEDMSDIAMAIGVIVAVGSLAGLIIWGVYSLISLLITFATILMWVAIAAVGLTIIVLIITAIKSLAWFD
jgi:hypothetical protein